MKQGIHPKYYPAATVVCSCGQTWTTGSTRETLHTDVCFHCHPFFTGEQRIVDTEGQVDRFIKKLDARAQFKQQEEQRKVSRMSPELPVTELNLGPRAEAALARAEITTIGQLLDKIQQGDEAILAVEGFGRKSLADAKKRLRARGFELAAETPAQTPEA
jgi:large subunit ribosomal protein L31